MVCPSNEGRGYVIGELFAEPFVTVTLGATEPFFRELVKHLLKQCNTPIRLSVKCERIELVQEEAISAHVGSRHSYS